MVMPFIAGILKSVDDKKEEFLKAGAKNEAEAGSLAWGVLP